MTANTAGIVHLANRHFRDVGDIAAQDPHRKIAVGRGAPESIEPSLALGKLALMMPARRRGLYFVRGHIL
jgi:hypothetical protein